MQFRCLALSLFVSAFCLACTTVYAGSYSIPNYSNGKIDLTINGNAFPPGGLPYQGNPYGRSVSSGSSSSTNGNGAIATTFTWQPASGQNMTTDPPPSVVLVKETCMVAAASTYANAPLPGSCSNGLGVSSPFAVTSTGSGNPTLYSSSAQCSSTRYTIHSGGATITLPTCTPSAGATGDHGSSASVSYSAAVYPITISAPDPLGRPDLGDGKNQRVYGAQQPDSYLYVPGAVRAVGASSADMQWLLANGPVDMAIDNSVIPNTFVHGWTVSGDTLFINTPQNTDNPYPNYEFNSWIFKGLPGSNSSFGNNDVNLYVQNQKTQTTKIQTFFSGTATNWPGSDHFTPNWYHYYNQVYPAPGDYANISQAGLTDVEFIRGSLY